MSKPEPNIFINVTFKHVDASEALKVYASDKIGKCLQKFCHHDTEAHLVLKVEKTRQIAEISLHVDGVDMSGKEESDDLYASIDALVKSLSHQLRKHKEKLTKHH